MAEMVPSKMYGDEPYGISTLDKFRTSWLGPGGDAVGLGVVSMGVIKLFRVVV